MPPGSTKIFTPKTFEQAWIKYFKWCDDNPWVKNDLIKSGEFAGQVIPIPSVRPYSELGFCAYHNLGEHYLTELAQTLAAQTDEDSRRMLYILTQARAKCRSQKFEGAAVGAFNATLIARDLGLADKQQLEQSGPGGRAQQHEHSIKIELVDTGLQPAASEKDVEQNL